MLPSTLREKKHYLSVEIVSEEEISENDVRQEILDSCRSFLGLLEFARAGISIISSRKSGKKFSLVLVTDRKYVTKVRAALILISEVNGKKVMIQTKGVSGTLKRLRQKF